MQDGASLYYFFLYLLHTTEFRYSLFLHTLLVHTCSYVRSCRKRLRIWFYVDLATTTKNIWKTQLRNLRANSNARKSHWSFYTSIVKWFMFHSEIVYGLNGRKYICNIYYQILSIGTDALTALHLLYFTARNLISVYANTHTKISCAAEICNMSRMKPMRTNKYGNWSINLVWHRPMSKELINLFELFKFIWHLDSNSLIYLGIVQPTQYSIHIFEEKRNEEY